MRLSPATFWSLSFPEWRALLVPPRRNALARGDLEELMMHFPDRPSTASG